MIVAIINIQGDYMPIKEDGEKMKTFVSFESARGYCENHILASNYPTTLINMESGECQDV